MSFKQTDEMVEGHSGVAQSPNGHRARVPTM